MLCHLLLIYLLMGRNRFCPPKDHEDTNTTSFRFRDSPIRELVDALTQWARHRETDGNLSTMQQSALADYRSNPVFHLSNVKIFGEKAVLRAYFHFFDKLFFGQMLERYNDLQVPDRGWCLDKTTDGNNLWNICWFPRSSFLKLQSRINVYPKNDIFDSKARCLSRISTELHEMIHAFFRVYRRDGESWVEQRATIGFTGHGPAWQEVAHAIELACRDPAFLNLGLDLNLGRTTAFFYDYDLSDGHLTGYENNPWGLDAVYAEHFFAARNTAVKKVIRFSDIVSQVMRLVGVNSGLVR